MITIFEKLHPHERYQLDRQDYKVETLNEVDFHVFSYDETIYVNSTAVFQFLGYRSQGLFNKEATVVYANIKNDEIGQCRKVRIVPLSEALEMVNRADRGDRQTLTDWLKSLSFDRTDDFPVVEAESIELCPNSEPDLNSEEFTIHHSEFNQVPIITVNLNGEWYAESTKTAKALGYKNPRDAIIRHCKHKIELYADLNRGVVKHDGADEAFSKLNFIPLSDIDRLIVHSKLPEAQKFEEWVFDDVVVSVQTKGGYILARTQNTSSNIMTFSDNNELLIMEKRQALHFMELCQQKDKLIQAQDAELELIEKELEDKSVLVYEQQKQLKVLQTELSISKSEKDIWVQTAQEQDSKIIELVQEVLFLKEMIESLQSDDGSMQDDLAFEIEHLNQKISEYETKIREYESYITNSSNLYTATQIGKLLGISANDLNECLSEYGYQYRQNGSWCLYEDYSNKGWVEYKSGKSTRSGFNYVHMYWTELGLSEIIHFFNEKFGILPNTGKRFTYEHDQFFEKGRISA